MALRPPTDLERERLAHIIDPAVQAYNREYYLRNRKLKGRKKGRSQDLSSDRKFLNDTPMRVEGRSEAEVAKFVNRMQTMPLSQLRAEIKKFSDADAKSSSPSPWGGLEAMTAKQVLFRRGGGGSADGKKDPRTGKSMDQIHKDARAKQRTELKGQIDRLTDRLNKLEALIRKKESEEASEDRKSKAKSERAAKERDKPKSAAEKAEAARENKKYRDKNQQKLKSKDSSSGGGDSKTSSDSKSSGEKSVSELRSLATKVKGQVAVAKAKLAAL